MAQFSFASPSLSGHTYDSAKVYSQQVLTPLLRGCILLDEAIKEACLQLPARYRQQVDCIDLKESELVEKIYRADRLIGRYQELIQIENHRDSPDYNYIYCLRQGESNQRQLRMRLEEKLRKLREFNTNSSQIFSTISTLADAVNTGLRQAKTAWNVNSQTFTIPPASELGWVESIEKRWDNSREHSTSELDDNSRNLLKKAEDDKKSGKISQETYQSISSAILNGGAGFIHELAKSKITDEVVSKLTQKAVEWLMYNSQNMQYGAVGAVAGGGNYTVPINVNPAFSKFVSGVARYGAPVLGGAIDFGMQIQAGESTGHALIKTGAHVAIGIGGAKAGAAIGAAIGTGIPIPIIGTVSGAAIGAVAGFVIGVVGSMVFDGIYDNMIKPIINHAPQCVSLLQDSITKGLDSIGNAVDGFFSGLGSIFS